MVWKILKYLLRIFFILLVVIILINCFIIFNTRNKIIKIDDIKKIDNIDCILILGAGIWGNYPTPMLEDRLKIGISLHKEEIAPKILVSGDHINEDHDEVNVMKDYLVGHSVPSQDVFMDHAGISTYDSIYRAKKLFKAKKIVIVTQEYHLYRSLYIANKLDLNAYGVASNQRKYRGQLTRELREILARIKDFFKVIVKPTSTYLGEQISLNGNGDITND